MRITRARVCSSQETVRSDRAHAMIGGREYAAHVSGLRVGEFGGLDLAKAAALDAAQTKTAPRGCAGP
jgi:hypothetical protein